MIYISNGREFALPHDGVSDNSNAIKVFKEILKSMSLSEIDTMFIPGYIDDIEASNSMREIITKAKNRIVKEMPKSINIGGIDFGPGVSIIFGLPGTGKTYFVDNTMTALKIPVIRWNEQGSDLLRDTFPSLLYDISNNLQTYHGVVVDSIKKLSVAITDNLGKGGFSRRVLLLVESLDSVARYLGAYLFIVVNPMEMSSDVIATWLAGMQSVASSVVVCTPVQGSYYATVRPGIVKGTPGRGYQLLGSSSILTYFEMTQMIAPSTKFSNLASGERIVVPNSPGSEVSIDGDMDELNTDLSNRFSKFRGE